MIRLKKGYTRFVILTGDVVIKIAFPFRPLVPFAVVFRALCKRQLTKELQWKKGSLIRTALYLMTVAGIDANKREVRISREHPEYPIAPVVGSYLWDLVIVMMQGEPAEMSSALSRARHALPIHLRESDFFEPYHVCRIGEKECFIDYGNLTADEILARLAELK